MKTKPLSKLLLSYGACDDARYWADAQDYAAAWESCERGDCGATLRSREIFAGV